MLVGNKTDLGDKREVTSQMGEEEAKRCGALFVETSAKVGANVKGLFRRIAQALPGMEGEGQQGGAESQSEFSVIFSGRIFVELTTCVVIDVNINPQKPESDDGCAC